jgi:hypothetical protein
MVVKTKVHDNPTKSVVPLRTGIDVDGPKNSFNGLRHHFLRHCRQTSTTDDATVDPNAEAKATEIRVAELVLANSVPLAARTLGPFCSSVLHGY